jgi:hypothetical protein
VLSPILAPLEPVKNKLLVIDGLDMKSAVGEQHQAGIIALLTGTVQSSANRNYAGGPSIDQLIASRFMKPRRSLELAVRWATGKSHGLLSPMNSLNFENAAGWKPIPPRLDPVQIWNDLFKGQGASPDAEAMARIERKKSILDFLDKRYVALAQRLGSEDRVKLEQHLSKIRELERGLPQVVAPAARCKAPVLVDTRDYNPLTGLNSNDNGSVKDTSTDAAIPKVGKLMMDMLVMALACDTTAVATLQWSDTEAKHTFPWLKLSEHSLLDESVVFFGSELQEPPSHGKTDMPLLLAGNGGGLRTGRWLKYDHLPHNNLLVSLLNLFGDTRTTLGNPSHCSGPLKNLT